MSLDMSRLQSGAHSSELFSKDCVFLPFALSSHAENQAYLPAWPVTWGVAPPCLLQKPACHARALLVLKHCVESGVTGQNLWQGSMPEMAVRNAWRNRCLLYPIQSSCVCYFIFLSDFAFWNFYEIGTSHNCPHLKLTKSVDYQLCLSAARI